MIRRNFLGHLIRSAAGLYMADDVFETVHGQIGWTRSLENTIEVYGCPRYGMSYIISTKFMEEDFYELMHKRMDGILVANSRILTPSTIERL